MTPDNFFNTIVILITVYTFYKVYKTGMLRDAINFIKGKTNYK